MAKLLLRKRVEKLIAQARAECVGKTSGAKVEEDLHYSKLT